MIYLRQPITGSLLLTSQLFSGRVSSLFGFGSGWTLSIWLFVFNFIKSFSIELRLPGGCFSISPPSAILFRYMPFMTKLEVFLLVELAIVLIVGRLCFKNFKTLRKAIYWTIFPNIVSVWSKKMWDKDFNNSWPLTVFMFVFSIASLLNFLVFKYLITI